MLPTKLTLSAEERLLMMDTRFILTKNGLLKKVELLLGELSERIRQRVVELRLNDSSLFVLSPKIARGEQYQSLPWVMLDYPRVFTRTDSCAIRCFFWWGNYWTITLQLAGVYLDQYKQSVEAFVQEHLTENDWYLSVGEDQWQHQLEPTTYVAAASVDKTYWLRDRPFLKLVKKIPLEQWDDLFPLLENNIVSLLLILKSNQAPSL
ncbi:MAG TPA: hypothetical protein DHW64_01395 [Chitinophagaceae bacterium]|nr:hypothetical protein [Chitinophagaceae bacterium]